MMDVGGNEIVWRLCFGGRNGHAATEANSRSL